MTRTAVVRSLAVGSVAALLLTLAPWNAATASDKPQPQQTAPASPADEKAAAFPGEDSEAKRKDILRLLELNGVRDTTAAMLGPMLRSVESMPGMTPDAIEAVKQEFMASLDDLLEMSVKPYADHLSHEDIKAAIAFAESPAGRRIAAAQPKIVAETTALGVKWGQSLQPRIDKRIQEVNDRNAEGGN